MKISNNLIFFIKKEKVFIEYMSYIKFYFNITFYNDDDIIFIDNY